MLNAERFCVAPLGCCCLHVAAVLRYLAYAYIQSFLGLLAFCIPGLQQVRSKSSFEGRFAHRRKVGATLRKLLHGTIQDPLTGSYERRHK